MKVLVIGGGGREHALAWKIGQSPRVEQVYVAPGNAGTAQLAQNIRITPTDIKTLGEAAQSLDVDLTPVITVPQHAARLYYLSGTGTPPPPEMTLGGRT